MDEIERKTKNKIKTIVNHATFSNVSESNSAASKSDLGLGITSREESLDNGDEFRVNSNAGYEAAMFSYGINK